MKFPIGTPVIINYYDRPSARLVAIVSRVESSWVGARYLCRDLGGQVCEAGLNDGVTLLADFGVELKFSGDMKYYNVGFVDGAIPTDSKATYRDGTPRHWQDSFVGWFEMDEEAARLLLNSVRK